MYTDRINTTRLDLGLGRNKQLSECEHDPRIGHCNQLMTQVVLRSHDPCVLVWNTPFNSIIPKLRFNKCSVSWSSQLSSLSGRPVAPATGSVRLEHELLRASKH